MKNYEKELDVISLNLKNVADTLLCFLDFCKNSDEEEIEAAKVSHPDFAAHSCWFLSELKRQRSLIELSVLTLNRESDILDIIYDEQQEMQVSRSA